MDICKDHAKTVAEMSRMGAILEMQGERLDDATQRLHGQSERFERLLGSLEPTLDTLKTVVKDQRKVTEDLKMIGAEAMNAKGEAATAIKRCDAHEKYHKDKTRDIKWLVAMSATFSSLMLGAAKAFGII